MNSMDLNGQTAPESTHGLFGPPTEIKIDKRRSAIEFSKSSGLDFTSPKSQSVYGMITSNNNNNGNRLSSIQQQQRSGLHTVNEEDNMNKHHHRSSIDQKSSSSILYFNETSIGQYNKRRSSTNALQDYRRFSSGLNNNALFQDENNNDSSKRISRADALAEAEAKLNGYNQKKSSSSSILLLDTNKLSTTSSRPTSLRPLNAFNNNNNNNNNNKLLNDFSSSNNNPNYHYSQQQQQKQNRRLSEPNARQYIKYSDQYSDFQDFQQQQQLQRKSQRMTISSNFHLNNNNTNNNNRRASLQLLNSNNNNGGLEGRRSGAKPAHLLLDTNNNENRKSRNFNNDWRSSTYSMNSIVNNNNNGSTSPGDRSSVYGFVPFTPTRMSFSREDNTIQQQLQQRKALFTPHLPFSALAPYLKTHQLVSGMLRVNKRNRSDAYVFCETFNCDIYICGSRDRNRALEGDHVAVKLVEVDRVMREKMEKEEAKLARNNGLPVIRKPDEEDEKEIIFGGEEDVDKVKPRYCGIITAILERAQNQMFSGTLGLMRPNSKRQNKHGHHDDERENIPRIIWFKPTDKRVPLIAIPVDQAPPGFIENSSAFEDRLFLGSIKRWPITSLHPFGVLEAELGSVDKLDVQFRGILADNNFINNSFKNEVLSCLPSLPLSLPSKDALNNRRDLRSLRCFTIDNQEDGEKDVALSIEKLKDETYQIGLHVSDFTAFIKPQSPIDKEARDRASGIYLHKSVPLWPTELLEQCTDLLPNQDRYAFSVMWKFNEEHKIIETWFGKTIIRSYAIVVPNEIQDSLTNHHDIPEHIGNEGAKDLKKLYKISQTLKEKRMKEGGLFIAETQLDIEMIDESPVDIAVKPELMSNDILNEFKVLANIMVAQKITKGLPESALLQSQSPPNERKLLELVHYLQGLGYIIDPTNVKTLQASVDAIDNVDAKSVITTLILKTMQPMKYFCTGSFDISRYHHYSMNVPLYTNFTSPSRKYASIIVHRQLETVLQQEEEERKKKDHGELSPIPSSTTTKLYLDSEYVQKLAQHCNAKEKCLLNAQEQSQHLLLSNYLTSSKQTSITHEAIVVGVQEQTFDVIVPTLGLERRIHVMNLPLRHSQYHQKENVLYLYWLPGVPTTDTLIEQQDDYDDIDDMDDFSSTMTTHLNKSSSPTSNTHSSSSSSSSSSMIDQEKKEEEQMIHQLGITSSTSTSINNEMIKRRPRSLSLRAIEGESLKSQQKCTIPQECCLVIRPFDFIRVAIIADSIRNPPLIRVLASNPFVNHES